jgi:hypothetical protein
LKSSLVAQKYRWNWNTTTNHMQSTGEGAAANLVAFAEVAGRKLGKEDAEKILMVARRLS